MKSSEDKYAAYVKIYDSESKAIGWHAPEILFGLTYEHLKPGQTLLDIGIGTGLASELFYRAGLKVLGMDNSPSMLNACRQKFPDFELTEQSILNFPWPYPDNSCDLVISTGAVHFFGELERIISEAFRITLPNGLVAFDIHLYDPEMDYEELKNGVYFKDDLEYDTRVYAHTVSYVTGILSQNNAKPLKSQTFIVSTDDKMVFHMIVARKKEG
jgi:ubiquinone/menaquinone biosynthesis C-methylase UbiE